MSRPAPGRLRHLSLEGPALDWRYIGASPEPNWDGRGVEVSSPPDCWESARQRGIRQIGSLRVTLAPATTGHVQRGRRSRTPQTSDTAVPEAPARKVQKPWTGRQWAHFLGTAWPRLPRRATHQDPVYGNAFRVHFFVSQIDSLPKLFLSVKLGQRWDNEKVDGHWTFRARDPSRVSKPEPRKPKNPFRDCVENQSPLADGVQSAISGRTCSPQQSRLCILASWTNVAA